MLRRRMMMQYISQNPLYSLVSGHHKFSDGGEIFVSENHVKILRAENNTFCNYSNVNQNTDNSQSQSNISWIADQFAGDIKTGDRIRLEIKNLQNSALVNFVIRKINANANILSAGSGQYNTYLKIEDIVSEDSKIGCFALYYNSGHKAPVEFDVEFYVNDERWI